MGSYSAFSLGEPYKSADEASKAKRNSVLGLCFLIAVQIPLILFFWWMSVNSTPSSLPVAAAFDELLLLIFATALYFRNSRVIAVLFVAFAAFELVSTMILKISATGSYSPPAMGLFIFAISIQLAAVVF